MMLGYKLKWQQPAVKIDEKKIFNNLIGLLDTYSRMVSSA